MFYLYFAALFTTTPFNKFSHCCHVSVSLCLTPEAGEQLRIGLFIKANQQSLRRRVKIIKVILQLQDPIFHDSNLVMLIVQCFSKSRIIQKMSFLLLFEKKNRLSYILYSLNIWSLFFCLKIIVTTFKYL